MFMSEEDPERCQRYRERAMEFGKDYIYWFAEDGASFAYGRSCVSLYRAVAFH